jgi:hypothetical protein
MIRVEIEEIANRGGIYRYSAFGGAVEGCSRQPLLDACRQIKRMGGDPSARAGLFRAGRTKPDMVCTIEAGAALTVVENQTVGPRFGKFREFDACVLTEAAE